jgi:malate permease and related proteins
LTATAFAALAIIIAGYACKRARVLTPAHGDVLVQVVLYLAMPALVFMILARAELPRELLLIPVAGWLVHLILLGVSFSIARLRRMDRRRMGAFVVAVSVGNTGFFGLPLIAASGSGFSLSAAVMYDALATGVITWTSTVAVATAFGADDTSAGLKVDWNGLLRGLSLPPTWALVAGLVWNLAEVGAPPVAIARPLEILGAAALPLVMLYAGLMFETSGLRKVWGDVAAITVLRLGVGGLVGYGVGVFLGLSADRLPTVAVMAAMPTAMMSLVLGARYGLRTDVLAGAVVVTTVLCTLTLPLVRALVA